MKKVLAMFLVMAGLSVWAADDKAGEVVAVDQIEAQVCSAEIDGALQDSSIASSATTTIPTEAVKK